MPLNRRQFLSLVGGGTVAGLTVDSRLSAAQDPLLKARPTPSEPRIAAGRLPIGLGGDRDGLLYVPETLKRNQPAPLVVMLHGAGKDAASVDYTFPLGAEFGVIILAPESRGRTWDAILDRFGPDVSFIDMALRQTFARWPIDPRRVSLAGFSDGASYALSLGLTNGELFQHLIAFSPGFMPYAGRHGKPRIFVAHGTQDAILPIETASRLIVPRLRADGYDVTYREFDGPHTVPAPIAHAAFEWLMAERDGRSPSSSNG